MDGRLPKAQVEQVVNASSVHDPLPGPSNPSTPNLHDSLYLNLGEAAEDGPGRLRDGSAGRGGSIVIIFVIDNHTGVPGAL